MNKKKATIIASIIIIIIIAILFSIWKVRTLYLFNPDGTLTDGRLELIEHLKTVEDLEERQKQVDFCIESKIITQKEANEIMEY